MKSSNETKAEDREERNGHSVQEPSRAGMQGARRAQWSGSAQRRRGARPVGSRGRDRGSEYAGDVYVKGLTRLSHGCACWRLPPRAARTGGRTCASRGCRDRAAGRAPPQSLEIFSPA